ncbi:hypothetical protein [Photobacterium damselae]|uniref:hypothetical protein n=1 Tax=Photobacterium damselae TaxID=38293 RepID=UPI001EFE4AA9|nr:hypothetical protein [Photobacterium damselae]MCG9705079.1 hypothetical protein [Photobacterium damselae]
MSKNKKLKQKQKKQAILQNNRNKQVKESNTNLSFNLVPIEFLIACPNLKISKDEIDFLSEKNINIPAYIYPINEKTIHEQNLVLKSKDLEPFQYYKTGWMVISAENMQPIGTFDKLELAKDFIYSTYPNIKQIRYNSLGLKSGYPNFHDIPNLNSTIDKEQWIEYCLHLEEQHGFLFDPQDLIEYLIKKLITEHDIPTCLYNSFYNNLDISPIIDFIKEKRLISYLTAFEILSSFEYEISKINK